MSGEFGKRSARRAAYLDRVEVQRQRQIAQVGIDYASVLRFLLFLAGVYSMLRRFRGMKSTTEIIRFLDNVDKFKLTKSSEIKLLQDPLLDMLLKEALLHVPTFLSKVPMNVTLHRELMNTLLDMVSETKEEEFIEKEMALMNLINQEETYGKKRRNKSGKSAKRKGRTSKRMSKK